MPTAELINDTGGRSDEQDIASGAALVCGIRLGERQTWDALAVYPLVNTLASDDAPDYVALGEALRHDEIVITEVSQGGSVPEIRVVNNSDSCLLILDGEELCGARQNRVPSTSILVDAHSMLVIPVSCVEQGRWAYSSTQFAESEIVAERTVRWAMKDSTHASLLSGTGHRPAQGRVWVEVERLHRKHAMASPTGAMRDVYARRKRELDQVLAAFPLIEGQVGLLVMHDSRAVGMDFVSRPPVYAAVHSKLLRSYALEALRGGGEPGDRAVAEQFLERIGSLQGQRFDSPGEGFDFRFEGDGLLGSVLVSDGHAVHAAFFDVGGATATADDCPPEDRPSWSMSLARERALRPQAR